MIVSHPITSAEANLLLLSQMLPYLALGGEAPQVHLLGDPGHPQGLPQRVWEALQAQGHHQVLDPRRAGPNPLQGLIQEGI